MIPAPCGEPGTWRVAAVAFIDRPRAEDAEGELRFASGGLRVSSAVAVLTLEVDDPLVASAVEGEGLSTAFRAFRLRLAGGDEIDVDPANRAEIGFDRGFGDQGVGRVEDR